MTDAKKKNPAGGPGFSGIDSGQSRPAHLNPLDSVLQRLEGVRAEGKGWRSLCPSCGGKSRKVSLAEGTDGRVLVHAFCGCSVPSVLSAVGLTLRDLHPPRGWPESPDEKRNARRALRESGWRAALSVLAREATVVQIAGRLLCGWQVLSVEDDARLALAVARIDGAKAVLHD